MSYSSYSKDIERRVVELNDDLPYPWRVQREANGRFAAFYGAGARKNGFVTPEDAYEWAQENA